MLHVRAGDRGEQSSVSVHRSPRRPPQLSHHHGNNKAKKTKLKLINRFHMTQYAYLLERLKAIPEGDGTLLDHCMIAYGSGNSDGNAHNHDNLPILLRGQRGRHDR